MTIEEKCAERYAEGSGGYLVCVEETQRHDATIEVIQMGLSFLTMVAILIFTYLIRRSRE